MQLNSYYKKQVDIDTMQECLHKIGTCLLGKLMICIDNAIMFAQNLNAPAEKIKNMH